MTEPLAARAQRATDTAERITKDAAKHLLACLGRTGEPHCLLVMVLDRPDRHAVAAKIGRAVEQVGAGWVVRHVGSVAEVADALPDVAGLLGAALSPREAFRVVVDMGWATVEVFALDEQDRSLHFARHIGTVAVRDHADPPAN